VAFKIPQNRVFGRGSAPDPAREAHDAPPDPLVGWRGDTPPHMPPHSTRTHLRHSPCVPPPEVQTDLRLCTESASMATCWWRRGVCSHYEATIIANIKLVVFGAFSSSQLYSETFSLQHAQAETFIFHRVLPPSEWK